MQRFVLGMVMVSLAGCYADADEVGTVGVPLTSADSSGGRYRLPAGTRLVMQGGTFYDELSLDGEATFARFDVPVGDYEASLINDAGYTTQWPLEHVDLDGTVDVVNAVLTTPTPAPVTIAEDALTNLVWHFDVPGAGPVVFAHGDVEVTIDVDETVATSVDADLAGTFAATSVTTDPTTPPELLARLPDASATGVTLQLGGHVATPWTQQSASSACADLDPRTTSSSHAGLADLLAESEVATLCVYGGEGITPAAEIFTYRVVNGTATTPTFSDLGSQQWLFLSYISVELPEQVFDGTTLDLAALASVGAVPATGFTRASVRLTGETSRRQWYRALWSGTVDVSLLLGS